MILSTVLTKSFYKRVVLTLCFLLPAWSDIGLGDVKELFPSTIEDPAHWSVLPPNMMAAVDWQRIQEMNYSHPRKTIELIHRLQGQEGRLGPVDQREALLFLLEAHLLLYETHEAATLLDVLRPKLSELDGVQTVRFWGAEGTYAWIVGHSEKGIEALNKSIELARQLGDPRLQSKRLNDLAWLHINSSELPQAMDAALEAERLTRPYPRSYELAYSLMSVAGALTVTRHRDESIELSQEALKILQELQYDYTASMVLFNMMAAYQRSKQCDKAIEMSESIIALSSKLEDSSTLAYVYVLLGRCYLELKNDSQASEFIKRALPILRETNDVTAFFAANDTLIPIYLGAGRFTEAELMLKEYNQILQESYGPHAPPSMHYHYQILYADYEFKSGAQLKGYERMQELAAHVFRNYEELGNKSVKAASSELELELKKKQNEALKALSQSQADSIEALKKVRNLFLVTIVLSALLLLSMYRSHLKNKQFLLQKEKIDLLMATVDEGILQFGANFKVDHAYSRAAAELLHQGKDLTGVSLLQLLKNFQTAEAVPVNLLLETTSSVLWGEKALAWELNAHQLPDHLQNGRQYIRLTWKPIFHQGRLHALVLVLSDVTALIESEEQRKKAQEETTRLLHVVGVVGDKLPKALRVARQLSDFLQNQRGNIEAGDKTTLSNLHTFKGNCATLNMVPLQSYIHELEGCIKQSEPVSIALQGIEAQLQIYAEIANRFTDEGTHRLLTVTNTLDDILSKLCQRIEEHNFELDCFEFTFNRMMLPQMALEWVETFFLHGLSNALDHGFVFPEKAQASRIRPRPRFALSILEKESAWELSLKDNGAGIDLQRVARLCRERGVEVSLYPCLTDVLFLPEFSTATELTSTSGRGVGLAAIHQLAVASNGSVTIRNRSDCPGTELILRIPKLT